MSDTINLTVQLTRKEYLRFRYYTLYRSMLIKIITIVGIICLINWVVDILFFDKKMSLDTMVLVFALIMLYLPLKIYFESKSTFYNSPIAENLTYTISNECIHVEGETFDSSFTWDRVYSVEETKYWILIWQTESVANIIPKKYFSSDDLICLKNIVENQKGIIKRK